MINYSNVNEIVRNEIFKGVAYHILRLWGDGDSLCMWFCKDDFHLIYAGVDCEPKVEYFDELYIYINNNGMRFDPERMLTTKLPEIEDEDLRLKFEWIMSMIHDSFNNPCEPSMTVEQALEYPEIYVLGYPQNGKLQMDSTQLFNELFGIETERGNMYS